VFAWWFGNWNSLMADFNVVGLQQAWIGVVDKDGNHEHIMT